MKSYSLMFGINCEGASAVARFTKAEDAATLLRLFEEQRIRIGEPRLYADYMYIEEDEVYSSVEEYLTSPNAYDPSENYSYDDDEPPE